MNTMSRDELNRMRLNKEDFFLLNVLSRDSFQDRHIPGSVNIPVNDPDFVGRVEERAGGKGRAIICYCGSQQCDASHHAAQLLMEAGFTNVYRYEGGLADWEKAGLPLEGSMVGVHS